MSGKKKSYPIEFKESAIKLVIESGKSSTQVAKELGINPNTMHTWGRARSTPKSNINTTREVNYHFDEIKKLKKELAQAVQERDILKKATAYFAKEYR